MGFSENINKNSAPLLKIYNVIHYVRSFRKGEGLFIFIHEALYYKLRKDVSLNSEALNHFQWKLTKSS